MEKRLILRGLLCGGIAGVLAFAFARIFAEPQIQKAVDYENGRDAAQDALNVAAGMAHAAPEHEVFTRTIQANLGIGVGIVGFGLAMGAIFAVVYILCVGRVGDLRPRGLSLAVAGFLLLGFYLVPFAKYPANPPAIGNPDTIGQRGTLYLVMVACSLGFLGLAVWFGQWLKPRFGTWNATLMAAAAFVVAIGVVMVLLPAIGDLAVNQKLHPGASTETPGPLLDPTGRIVYPGFPADVLASFRFYSVGAQVILWGVLGLLFAPMADKLLTPEKATATAEPVAV